MAEETKRPSPRKKRAPVQKKHISTKKSTPKKAEGFSLRKEVKGLILLAIAVVALLGIFGFKVGVVGEILTSIFQYGFGLGAIIPAVGLVYVGWRLLYSDTFISITKRGILFTLFFFMLLALIPLIRIPVGQELSTTNLLTEGGVVGGLIASVLRSLLGEIGSIIFDVILLLCCGMLITRLSLRKGLHTAKDKTQVGIDVAKEVATEKVQIAKERFEDWNEQRKEAAAERRAYNREKDTRYTEVAAAAIEAIGQRNIAKAETVESTLIEDALVVSTPLASTPVESAPIEPVHEAPTPVVSTPVEPLPVASEPIVHEPVVPVQPVDHVEDEYDDYDDFDDYQDDNKTYEDYHSTSVDDNPVVEDKPFVRESLISGGEDASRMTAVAESVVTESVVSEPVIAAPMAPHVGVGPVAFGVVPTMDGTTEDTAAVAVSTEGKIHRSIERTYHFPSLDILEKGKENQVASEEVARNASLLETTLSSFGITAKVVNATQGPAVTRYELEPAPGTKVSRIVNLTDDLKLSLAAADIRMEAPIPGKSAIGIEVPNKSISAVHLRDVLDCDDFKEARGGIPVGLGKDIAGKPIITDLAKMPHLLVAGSTGSGKSVCINTLISSILFSRKPEEVKLLLIDPKMVELSTYNGIPHLMAPVVTDMKKAAAVLRWAVREMEARYRTFAATGVRDVKRYNELHPKTAMPLVLIIIDELADLMMTAPTDIEESISRLAQMARAAGLHMVLATQRPSVNVITGTIKANVPSRISFAVATQIDSRTILDMAGAEKLLGKGDMLFSPIGANKPVRIQGAFISDDEVEELVSFVKAQGVPEYDETVTETEEQEDTPENKKEEFRDELLERAVNLVMESGQASVSMLQRRFRIGYTRAARLVDTMEDLKIVGPNVGSKARDILMSPSQVKEKYFPHNNDGEA